MAYEGKGWPQRGQGIEEDEEGVSLGCGDDWRGGRGRRGGSSIMIVASLSLSSAGSVVVGGG